MYKCIVRNNTHGMSWQKVVVIVVDTMLEEFHKDDAYVEIVALPEILRIVRPPSTVAIMFEDIVRNVVTFPKWEGGSRVRLVAELKNALYAIAEKEGEDGAPAEDIVETVLGIARIFAAAPHRERVYWPTPRDMERAARDHHPTWRAGRASVVYESDPAQDELFRKRTMEAFKTHYTQKGPDYKLQLWERSHSGSYDSVVYVSDLTEGLKCALRTLDFQVAHVLVSVLVEACSIMHRDYVTATDVSLHYNVVTHWVRKVTEILVMAAVEMASETNGAALLWDIFDVCEWGEDPHVMRENEYAVRAQQQVRMDAVERVEVRNVPVGHLWKKRHALQMRWHGAVSRIENAVGPMQMRMYAHMALAGAIPAEGNLVGRAGILLPAEGPHVFGRIPAQPEKKTWHIRSVFQPLYDTLKQAPSLADALRAATCEIDTQDHRQCRTALTGLVACAKNDPDQSEPVRRWLEGAKKYNRKESSFHVFALAVAVLQSDRRGEGAWRVPQYAVQHEPLTIPKLVTPSIHDEWPGMPNVESLRSLLFNISNRVELLPLREPFDAYVAHNNRDLLIATYYWMSMQKPESWDGKQSVGAIVTQDGSIFMHKLHCESYSSILDFRKEKINYERDRPHIVTIDRPAREIVHRHAVQVVRRTNTGISYFSGPTIPRGMAPYRMVLGGKLMKQKDTFAALEDKYAGTAFVWGPMHFHETAPNVNNPSKPHVIISAAEIFNEIMQSVPDPDAPASVVLPTVTHAGWDGGMMYMATQLDEKATTLGIDRFGFPDERLPTIPPVMLRAIFVLWAMGFNSFTSSDFYQLDSELDTPMRIIYTGLYSFRPFTLTETYNRTTHEVLTHEIMQGEDKPMRYVLDECTIDLGHLTNSVKELSKNYHEDIGQLQVDMMISYMTNPYRRMVSERLATLRAAILQHNAPEEHPVGGNGDQ